MLISLVARARPKSTTERGAPCACSPARFSDLLRSSIMRLASFLQSRLTICSGKSLGDSETAQVGSVTISLKRTYARLQNPPTIWRQLQELVESPAGMGKPSCRCFPILQIYSTVRRNHSLSPGS
ncbi:hypothetical protein AB395_00003226 [Sinorhizobium fredii CCBAU 45436]|nr:hypothetical protein AB395_00003226 [Sinorhizobium fredii CCBAU 45436]